MTINSGKISNILRTYSRQVKFGKVNDSLSKSGVSSSIDKVSLSPEAVKLLFITDILAEINSEDVTKDMIEKLVDDVDLTRMSEEEIAKLKEDIISQISQD